MLLFMDPLITFMILINLQDVASLRCECSGNQGFSCNDGCEAGSYCYTTWIVAHGAIDVQGCKTTRADLTNRQCQTNRKGLVTCVCSSDRCNDASFTIPSDAAFVAPPVIKCYSRDLNEDNFCFGHYCTYTAELVMNDFGDVFPSAYALSRGCSDTVYADDMDSVNTCIQTDDRVDCRCNTEFCNRAQPYTVPLGNLLCYRSQASTQLPSALKFCRGHLCYIYPKDYNGKTTRGCVSVSDGAPAELKSPGRYYESKFCKEDYCNGDFSEDAPTVTVEGSGSGTSS